MENRIGQRIKQQRIRREMTQDMVAQKLGTTRQRYARMENGQVDITYQDICLIADFLGISVADLTESKEEESLRSVISRYHPELFKIPEVDRLILFLEQIESQEELYQQMQERFVQKLSGEGKRYSYLSQKEIETLYYADAYSRSDLLAGAGNQTDPLERYRKMLAGCRAEWVRYPFSDEERGGLIFYRGAGRYWVITNSSLPWTEELQNCVKALVILMDSSAAVHVVSMRNDRAEESRMSHSILMEELLVPSGDLESFIRYGLRAADYQLTALQMLQIQKRYEITYEMAEHILTRRGLLDEEQCQRIRKGRRYYGEDRLAAMLGYPVDRLYQPFGKAGIPAIYVEHILKNYENGHIVFVELAKMMEYMGISVKELAGLRKPMDDRDNWDEY